VRDRGPGIDPTERERIFDRFSIRSTSPRLRGSAGSGWAVHLPSRGRAGRRAVWLDRSHALGSVFALRFPIGDDHDRLAGTRDVMTIAATAWQRKTAPAAASAEGLEVVVGHEPGDVLARPPKDFIAELER
jgi:hypothetical protein